MTSAAFRLFISTCAGTLLILYCRF